MGKGCKTDHDFICNAIKYEIPISLMNQMQAKVMDDVALYDNYEHNKCRHFYIPIDINSFEWHVLRADYCMLQKYICDTGGIG